MALILEEAVGLMRAASDIKLEDRILMSLREVVVSRLLIEKRKRDLINFKGGGGVGVLVLKKLVCVGVVVVHLHIICFYSKEFFRFLVIINLPLGWFYKDFGPQNVLYFI